MENVTLQKGVLETPLTEAAHIYNLPEAARTVGAIALNGEHADAPVAARRYGYREDSPPEVIDLLCRAQSGDTEAFAGIYQAHVGRVTRYVAYRMRDRNRDAIPDLVQDAFCEAFANLPSAHHDVTGWLLTHAAKACTRHEWSTRRYIRAAKTVEEEARSSGNAEPAPAAEVPAAIGHVTLVHALSRLVPDQRRAMQLRFLDGLPRKLRAEELDRSFSALKSLEWRALRNLRVSFQAPRMTGGS